MKCCSFNVDRVHHLRKGNVEEVYFSPGIIGVLYQPDVQRFKGKLCSCGSGSGSCTGSGMGVVGRVRSARRVWSVEHGDGPDIGGSGIWGGISGRALEARA